jgi:hypothetical protein
MNLSLFDNADQNQPSCNVTVADLYQIITGANFKNVTKRTKQLAAEHRDVPPELKPAKKEALKKAKLQLPAVSVSGTCASKARGVNSEARNFSHSGLLQLDFDHLEPAQIQLLRLALQSCCHVAMVFISPSGLGVKAFYRVQLPITPSADYEWWKQWHRSVFSQLRGELEAKFGQELDAATGNIGQLCFIPHDPDAYINQEAIPRSVIVEDPPDDNPRDKPERQPSSESTPTSPKNMRRILSWISSKDPTPEYPKWRDISWAAFHGVGVGEGINLMEEFFPPVVPEEYEVLSRSFDPSKTSWLSLGRWASTTDIEDLLEDFSDSEEAPLPVGGAKGEKKPRVFPLPATTEALLVQFSEPVEPLIYGIIGMGERLILSGSSKAGKTWAMLSLAMAVTNGTEWFGFACRKGRVLYVNLELRPQRMAERLRRLGGQGTFDVSNLAGQNPTWDELRNHLIRVTGETDYTLIIIDPIYKMANDTDENDNTQVAALLGEIEAICITTGVAVAFAHHFSKGNKAGSEAIDRSSGAGAWSRDPDAVLTLTNHKEEGHLVFEASVRNYRKPESSVWRFEWPHFVRSDLNPKELKKAGAQKKGATGDVAALLMDGPLTKSELIKRLQRHCRISDRTARSYIKAAEADSIIQLIGDQYSLKELSGGGAG